MHKSYFGTIILILCLAKNSEAQLTKVGLHFTRLYAEQRYEKYSFDTANPINKSNYTVLPLIYLEYKLKSNKLNSIFLSLGGRKAKERQEYIYDWGNFNIQHFKLEGFQYEYYLQTGALKKIFQNKRSSCYVSLAFVSEFIIYDTLKSHVDIYDLVQNKKVESSDDEFKPSNIIRFGLATSINFEYKLNSHISAYVQPSFRLLYTQIKGKEYHSYPEPYYDIENNKGVATSANIVFFYGVNYVFTSNTNKKQNKKLYDK